MVHRWQPGRDRASGTGGQSAQGGSPRPVPANRPQSRPRSHPINTTSKISFSWLNRHLPASPPPKKYKFRKGINISMHTVKNSQPQQPPSQKSATHNSHILCISAALFLSAGFFLNILMPKKEYSASERRPLAKCPPFSTETIQSGRFATEFEDFATDTFPFREQLRRLQVWTSVSLCRRRDQNGLYLAEGHLVDLEYPLQEHSLEQAVQRFEEIYQKYHTEGTRAWLSVIPDKNCFLAKQSGHLSMDYAEFEKMMEQKAAFAEYIQISDLLEKDDYYKTDPHWRQERIVDVAKRLAQRMGVKIRQTYTVHTLDRDFYGAYYGQAARETSADTIQYLTADVMDQYFVYDWQNGTEIPIYYLDKAAGRDPYELFLSGPLSLITMENPDADTDKQLVIFRDSFASSLAPLLLGGYDRVILADIRYIRPQALGDLIDFAGCDFLFLYSTLVLNHSETLLR